MLVFFMLVLSVRVVLAEGDKVRGDNAIGDPAQVCDTPNYDGEGCPYGDYEPSVTPPAYE